MTRQPLQEVSRALVSGSAAGLSLAVARESQLAPWAYFVADPDSEIRHACATDFAVHWLRLQRMYAPLRELLEGWATHGIDATLFKGFVVAHLAYPHPALRYFGDIDVHVPPEQIDLALVRLPPGWKFKPLAMFVSDPHEATYLYPPDRSVCIDLHRSLLPSHSCSAATEQRLTTRMLRDRQEICFAPAGSERVLRYRALSSVDLALIGLAVNRGWSGDHWRPKAHDYLDLRYFSERCSVTEAVIAERARDLGLARTWAAYRRAVSFESARCEMERLCGSWRHRFAKDLASTLDAGTLRLPLRRISRLPSATRDMLACLPALLSTLRRMRGPGGPDQLIAFHAWPLPKIASRVSVVRGTRWAARLAAPLIRSSGIGLCVVRSVTLFRLLNAQGYRPEWVCGFRTRTGGAPEGHAWVEIDGVCVEFVDDLATDSFVETKRITAP